MSSAKPIVLTKFYPRPFTKELLKDHKFLYEGSKGYLWRFNKDKGIWMTDGEDFTKNHFRTITDAIDDTLKKKHVIAEIIEDIKGLKYNEDGLPEAGISLIPFKDGVYDSEEDIFRRFSSNDYFTWSLPWKYNPKAKCSYLKELINSFLPKTEDAKALWELMAYTLLRGYPDQRFFILLGGGSNGKSTFMTILTRLLSKNNISNVSLEAIQNTRFSAVSLFHKLANINSELDYVDIEKTNQLKELTGGDTIHADRKFRNPIGFVNYAKLIFLTNQLPKTRDKTDAFYRRVFLVDFPKKFKLDTSIDMTIRADTEEMTEEYEGLMYEVLKHFKRLKKQKFKLSRKQDVDAIRKRYNLLSNPLESFLDECCMSTHNHKDFITKSDFLRRLNDWLRKKRHNSSTEKSVGSDMMSLGYRPKKVKIPKGHKRVPSWVGITWKKVA